MFAIGCSICLAILDEKRQGFANMKYFVIGILFLIAAIIAGTKCEHNSHLINTPITQRQIGNSTQWKNQK
jgi:hypothetical protein